MKELSRGEMLRVQGGVEILKPSPDPWIIVKPSPDPWLPVIPITPIIPH